MNDVITNGEGKESAIRLKELGNEDFKNSHFDKAVVHYSRAIGITTPHPHPVYRYERKRGLEIDCRNCGDR
jgi:hypothetical protein